VRVRGQGHAEGRIRPWLVQRRFVNKGNARGWESALRGHPFGGRTRNEAGMCLGINELTNYAPIADWVGEANLKQEFGSV